MEIGVMLNNFLKDEYGASAAEYCLLVVLVGLVIFIVLSGFGNILNTIFSNGGNTFAS